MSSLIDFILNIAALLLWMNWRSIHFDPFARLRPATLSGTVRRADPIKLQRWHFLAALIGLLLVRAAFYRMIGPDVNWTLKLDLDVVVLAYRGNAFNQTLLYSVSSFVQTLVLFYFWFLAITFVNRPAAEPDPFQKMIQLQLGKAARWPRLAQAILPGLVTAALWILCEPLLAVAGVINPAKSVSHLLAQGGLLGLALYPTLKNLFPIILFLHLIASYIYLGSNPLWDFITATSRNILAPLKPLPLRVGRFDFAPLVGIVLILLLLVALPYFVKWELKNHDLTLWPQ